MNVSVLLVTVAVEFVGRLVSLNATLFAYAQRETGIMKWKIFRKFVEYPQQCNRGFSHPNETPFPFPDLGQIITPSIGLSHRNNVAFISNQKYLSCNYHNYCFCLYQLTADQSLSLVSCPSLSSSSSIIIVYHMKSLSMRNRCDVSWNHSSVFHFRCNTRQFITCEGRTVAN